MDDDRPRPADGPAADAPPAERSWRDRLSDWLRDSVHDLEQELDEGWDRLTHRLGWAEPGSLQVYTGYANGRKVKLGCRVLAGRPGGGPKDDDGWWDNLLNSYRRWNTHELEGVEVRCVFRGQTHSGVSDEEGYVWLEFADRDDPGGYWQTARFEVVDDGQSGGGLADATVTAECGVVCPSRAAYGIISDMDDTVLFTGVTNLMTMAKLTFLGNARTRQPLAGVGALYRALVSGGGTQAGGARGAEATPEAAEDHARDRVDDDPVNPIFYVSSSPWNLHDLLHDFLEVNRIPPGPLRLRDLGVDEQKLIKTHGHGHKLVKARQIMDDFPELPFVLFGDSGQADAELYAQLAQRRAGQLRAIFIRDVDPGDEPDRDTAVLSHLNRAQAQGVPAMLIRDSTTAARRLVELGLLRAEAVDEVAAEVDQDHRRPTAAEAAVHL